VAAAEDEGTVWRSIEGQVKDTIVPPEQEDVLALAFSPDNRLLAYTTRNGIRIRDLRSPSSDDMFLEQLDVFSLAFSPDGKLVASGGKDGDVRLWQVATGSPKGVPLAVHRAPVNSVAFSPSGKLLASGSYDKTVVLWDVETQQQMMRPLENHGAAVVSVAFSSDGRELASIARDGSLATSEMSLDAWVFRACEVVNGNFAAEEWKHFENTIGLRSWRERLVGDGPHVTCLKGRLREADERAMGGDSAGAEQLFAETVRLALERKDWQVSNETCWMGSLDGFAKLVLPTCEQVISLAPEGWRDVLRDSRGLARGLTGDTKGAIEDFTAAMESIKVLKDMGVYDEAFERRREGWIEALKAGRNPFDAATRMALRNE